MHVLLVSNINRPMLFSGYSIYWLWPDILVLVLYEYSYLSRRGKGIQFVFGGSFFFSSDGTFTWILVVRILYLLLVARTIQAAEAMILYHKHLSYLCLESSLATHLFFHCKSSSPMFHITKIVFVIINVQTLQFKYHDFVVLIRVILS